MSKASSYSHIHALAQFFAVRSICDGVVLFTNDHKTAIAAYPDSAMIYLLQTNDNALSQNEITKLPENVTILPLKEASREILKNKIFVCLSPTEYNVKFHQTYGRKSVLNVSKNAALSIWIADETASLGDLRKRLRHNKTALVGRLADGTVIGIDGQLTNVYRQRYSTLPVLAIVSQFNEIDIIEPVIHHLLNQGVDVHVIDNWSNDGSYEAVEEIARRYPKRVSVERFPKHDSHQYEWKKILNRVTQVANEKPHYKWIISNDADEIRWSPWEGVTLQKAISFIDHVGFNVVDYTVFNFSPTKDGYRRGIDPVEFFEYGDFGHEGWHFMQLKTWRNNPSADIASSSGHLVDIPDPRIFPLKFLLAHYSLRSSSQAAKKVFQDRKPRFLAGERQRGWHSHYDKISSSQAFIKDKAGLITISKQSGFRENYLIERLSGIGVKINEIKRD